MGPDIPRLGVDSEDGLETSVEGVEGWPVAGVEEIVVLEPLGQVVEVADVPRGGPGGLRRLAGPCLVAHVLVLRPIFRAVDVVAYLAHSALEHFSFQ